MNKTLNINLGGLIFHIDEDAYKSLETYLSKIKKYLNKEEGAAEIIQDIETRIAELFRSWKSADHVIGQVEVDKVQEMLGRPEQYLIGEESNEEIGGEIDEESSKSSEKVTRKLFRDREAGMLGGVCAGIANYFSVDKMWIRLIMLVLLIGIGWLDFGGTTFVMYIILWIIVPEAKTTSERLQMHGKPINLENIKESAEEIGGQIKNGVENSGLHIRNLGDLIVFLMKGIAKIILIIIGVSILFVAFILLITFFGGLSGLAFGDFEYAKLFKRIVVYDWEYYLGMVVVIMSIISVLILMINLSLSMIMRRMIWNKKFTIVIMALFFITIPVLIAFTISQYNQYTSKYNFEKEYTLPIASKDSILLEVEIEDAYNEDELFENIKNQYTFNEKDELIEKINGVYLIIKKSKDDQVHLINRFKGSGKNKKEALKNTKAIGYNAYIDSSKIVLGSYIKLPKEIKLRNQKTESELYLPVNQKIKIGSGFNLKGNLAYDLYWNEGNNRIWQMTEEGLVCRDCGTNQDDFKINVKDKITIDSHGINIKDKIIIDSNGIKIKTDGEEDSIGNNTNDVLQIEID